MRIRALQLTLFVCLTRLAFAGCPTPVMTQANNLTGGDNSIGLAVADFDKDGHLDYAIPSSGPHNILVYLGHGDGTFATAVPYPVGGNLYHPVAADFNGDGFLDIGLIVRDASAYYVAVLLNNGNGTFAAVQRNATAMNLGSTLKAVDMNDDGKMDVVVAGDVPVRIFYGAGDGTFGSVDVRYRQSIVDSAAGADVNNDGHTDLITASVQFASQNNPATYSLAIYLRGPNGLPQSPSMILSAHDPNGGDILPIDLDGDEFRDIVASSSSDKVISVYLNKGDGTFNYSPVDYPLVTQNFNEGPGLIVPGDINEDGVTDLVFGVGNTDQAEMMVGNGDGTFQAAYHVHINAPHYFLQLQGAAVGDVNGDGRPDILLADSTQNLVYLLTNGCPSRYAAVTLGSSANPSLYGDSVTITATVTARNGGHAGGTVSFFDGATSLGSVPLSGATPSTAALTVPKFSPGAHTITANYSGDATYGSSSGKLTQTVNRPAFATPLDFRATGDPAANTIALQWVGSTEATSYEVWRLSGGLWSLLGTTGSEALTDSGVSSSQAYFYKVRALKTGSAPTDYCTPDAATTYNFAHTFGAGTKIFAADMSDLRTCVNNLRTAAGVGTVSFTDGSLAGVLIKAQHMTELRNALSPAMTAAGMPAPSFTRSVAIGTSVFAIDFTELRTMMR
ncbi:MAG: hypothetical protein QOC81_3368 [Thermoanaerobaculia bacterium]|jgi:hypothetical protein|nr:hypothetical protein [Thermoanaerobaculia bacterium]